MAQRERKYVSKQVIDKSRVSHIEFDGSAARNLAMPAPVEVPVKKEYEEEQKKVSRQTRKNRDKARHMSPVYVAFLTAVCGIIMFFAINYITLQSSIQMSLSQISALQSEIEAQDHLNSEAEARIAIACNVNDIFITATEELGMVYPDDGQVIYYDQTEREYVQQYEAIPK